MNSPLSTKEIKCHKNLPTQSFNTEEFQIIYGDTWPPKKEGMTPTLSVWAVVHDDVLPDSTACKDGKRVVS
jgi:hypothetical protein